jgi:DmsE family decaheme c-type cytochrome
MLGTLVSMKIASLRPWVCVFVALLSGHATGAVASAPGTALPESVENCLLCHDDDATQALLAGPHASTADSRTGFAEHGCGNCHGNSEAHMRRPPRGEPRAAPDHVFGPAATTSAADQNMQCTGCHRGTLGMHWQGSPHEAEGLTCVGCHRVHTATDTMHDAESQSAACFGCHPRTRAETLRASSHPLRDGQMACSDCHAVHGSVGPGLLRAATLNESCYECHAELRGPFLWEHPPAREDCSNCHRPHGSNHAPLLTQRAPWLCQQCHLAQFHPSTALSGSGLPGPSLPSGSQSLLGRNCMNCHPQVHGSNHPSGAGQTR